MLNICSSAFCIPSFLKWAFNGFIHKIEGKFNFQSGMCINQRNKTIL